MMKLAQKKFMYKEKQKTRLRWLNKKEVLMIGNYHIKPSIDGSIEKEKECQG